MRRGFENLSSSFGWRGVELQKVAKSGQKSAPCYSADLVWQLYGAR